MNVGDKIRVSWYDGEVAIGFFVRKERGFAIFVGDDGKEFVALCRESTRMEIIEKKID